MKQAIYTLADNDKTLAKLEREARKVEPKAHSIVIDKELAQALKAMMKGGK